MREPSTEDRDYENRTTDMVGPAVGLESLDPASMSDEEMLLEYRLTGSQEIFEALVKRYERELYGYLRRFLGNAALAEDAFQNTFLQVHLKCHLFDEHRKVRPWLYTVATHQAIDIQRRNQRHRLVSLDRPRHAEHEELGTLIDMLDSQEPSAIDRVELSEASDRIRASVAALPEQLQSAVRLVYFRGLKYQDAAEELSIPVGTVKSRLHTAIKRIGKEVDSRQ